MERRSQNENNVEWLHLSSHNDNNNDDKEMIVMW